MKPKIKETTFGSISVGKQTYNHDIVIELDKTVRKREKKLSKRLYGTSHQVSLDEIQDVYQEGARQLIVGTGQYNQLRLSEQAESFLKTQECQVVLLPTPDAMEKWNGTEGQGETIGLFHITC